ncbi:hypothetical protein Cgig2_020995 [Carnegiea gigantea]|uniref:TAFII-230 TBP-binding domain-containing protein n=1 Tax=Carnegiea gigantea TaxID=171969 RepID=A0A9Q1QF84_9CARY|nr:hypothetical protein Cgig2_020995 [Carnegiea gigantea]
MGSESGSASHDDRDSDDEEDYDEANGGNRLLGFMFGNVDNSGELDVDYLDEPHCEHDFVITKTFSATKTPSTTITITTMMDLAVSEHKKEKGVVKDAIKSVIGLEFGDLLLTTVNFGLLNDAKEHLDALADKLGPSLTDIDLSGKSPQTSVATVEEGGVKGMKLLKFYSCQHGTDNSPLLEPFRANMNTMRNWPSTWNDYDEKAEDAVDYEDIDEQYEGPEIEVATEEDHLLPKTEYLQTDVSAALEYKSSVFDDENYDEDEETAKESEAEIHTSKDEAFAFPDSRLNQQGQEKTELMDNNSETKAIMTAVEQAEKDEVAPKEEIYSESLLLPGQEERAASDDALDAKNVMPLPILCVEDGMPILRFSEIFGVNEPLKRVGRREQKYSVPKGVLHDKYITLDSSYMVEEDEEAFLKATCQIFSHGKHSWEVSEDNEVSMDENSEFMKFDVAEGARENFVESCELSGPDSESAFHEEREIVSRPSSHRSANQIIQDEKDNVLHVGMSSISVEPFGSRDSGKLVNISSETMHHPQLLRLESRLERDSSNLCDSRKELASEENQQLGLMKRFNQLTLQNKDLVEGSWVENIVWESEKPIPKPKLILDLQDEQMVFEISDNKDYEHLQHHAGAMIMTRNGKIGAESFELPGHVALSGGRFNIGNDKYYSNRKTSPQLKSLSKKRAAHSVKVLHSIPALKLQTMKPKLSKQILDAALVVKDDSGRGIGGESGGVKDIANFHRPKATWYPHDNEVTIKEQGKLPTQWPMKVILKSLGGKGCKIHVDAEETVTSFKSKASKKLGLLS